VGRFGARLHTESTGRSGTCPTPEPAKCPTFNAADSAPQLRHHIKLGNLSARHQAEWDGLPRYASIPLGLLFSAFLHNCPWAWRKTWSACQVFAAPLSPYQRQPRLKARHSLRQYHMTYAICAFAAEY